ncbi:MULTISPECIES: type 4 pilus major pilin [Asaia]|uniref:Type 4 secretion system PilS N-terminal domain-containing protein n=1 Tax=Asaia spathodeae TaxID=657016 RepID=A0ABX2P9B7_9PROT|nr:type 4 pilus major pilin [Asaia spathodeae]GBR20236.1 hypothetical protein AA105894_2509 [Asaia spathodeae NBRC 105894]
MWALGALFAALVIGAIMLGQSGALSNLGYTASGTEVAAAQTKTIADSIKQVLGGAGGAGVANFTGLSNSLAIKLGSVPSNMTNGDGQTITGAWSSAISITGSGDGNTFYVLWQAVPSTSCAKLAVSQSVNGVLINGNWVARTVSNFPASVAALCNQGVNSFSSVSFSFVMNYN